MSLPFENGSLHPGGCHLSTGFWALLLKAELPQGEGMSVTGGRVCLSIRHLVLAHPSHEKLKGMLGAIPQQRTRQGIRTEGKAEAAGRDKANERNAPQAGVILLLGSSSRGRHAPFIAAGRI